MTTSPPGDEPPRPGDAARRTGPALEAMFRFIVWLIPTLDKLPRSQKFLLGDRMQATALDVFERLIEATYSKARERALSDANLGLEKLRFLFRVCAELHYLDLRRYENAARIHDGYGSALLRTPEPRPSWPVGDGRGVHSCYGVFAVLGLSVCAWPAPMLA